ncbi:MAG: excinuclease ABC subunit UvrA, partial [Erysipelotrichaceae bacterium]|nr:excinuclease ABC subunit UvrA [Erysipelotrichaceae bacterium]
QLSRAVRNRTTGVLYVLDEPSIGLHPANIVGLNGVMHDLIKDGNSVILVDHDTQILKEADYMIELGPKAGADGGKLIAQGTLDEIAENKDSVIAPYLKKEHAIKASDRKDDLFESGSIDMETDVIHTVRPLKVSIPKNRLTVVTGVSGSGKTTMVLESLIPALQHLCYGTSLPSHVKKIEAEGIREVKLIDATPIGINVRSTVATYANVHDELRKIFARTADAKKYGYKASDFSYNTGSLRCENCDGTGQVSLDVQFLPDVDVPCPICRGSRYSKTAKKIVYTNKDGVSLSLPELMEMDVEHALKFCEKMNAVKSKLETLNDLGLGYLTLGEATPSLSGGEAQRLKLAYEMGKKQSDTLFIFDEPTIGLHPKDVETLLKVFDSLKELGATILVIEHDLDVIRSADYIIDMGPEGGKDGGRIVACGTPKEVKENTDSITGRFI